MTKHTVWTPTQVNTLISMAKLNYTKKEIASCLGIIPSGVDYKAKSLGIRLTTLIERTRLTDEELLERLKSSGTYTITSFKGTPGYSTYITRFGSWNTALKLAGCPINMVYYSDKELLDILKTSNNPTYNHFIQSNELPSAATYVKRFGSWANALDLAGLPQNSFSLIPNKPTNVYLIEFDGFYKVGITQQEVADRFLSYPAYEVILTLRCTLEEARKIEKEWLNNVKDHKVYGIGFPRNNGATECFKL